MTSITPVFRIFDYAKAIEFYIDWPGFSIDSILLNLSEHHGDCTPGASACIDGFENLQDYHHLLIKKS
ncbi:hypothetical protein HDE68_002865 [Pedobacter cryoconitis]|uniref:Uncharacterized protein n=1 Tax=Pedobacter cryoconitis TaxID=188932 RepID=A0A7W9DZ65_9SPHI|nr:hypothetical protein [Pedobacter cryoconitis]MBB5636952.1 hypothetical protein [Pedobacter cryoconitis]